MSAIGIAPLRFGRKVANDPRPVAALEGGRELGEESAERVLNFIAPLDAAKAVTHA